MKKGPVLILGAHSDIGKSITHKFASKGHDIQLAARRSYELETFSEQIKSNYSVSVKKYEFDILFTDKHLQFINDLDKLPEILICCVGLMADQKNSEKNKSTRIDVIRSNFEGPLNIISEFANYFEERGSGTIVGISSVAGDRGRATNYIYGSAKSGFSAFLSGLRNRLAKKNVHVVTVLPGPVNTKMISNLEKPGLLTSNTSNVANDIYSAVLKKKNIIYTMKIWRIIMFIIKIIPEEIFKKLKI